MNYRIVRVDPRCVTADAVTFAADVLTINLPQRTYNSGCPYFIRIDDPIPDATTIGSAVVITIGAGTVEYPLVDCKGAPVTAENLRSGYSYPVAVIRRGATGAFKILAPLRYCSFNPVFSVDGTEPEEGDGA